MDIGSDHPPINSISQLAKLLRADLQHLTEDNSEDIAYKMTQRLLLAQGHPWFTDSPTTDELFDLVGRLELPQHVYGDTESSRKSDWARVTELIEQLV